MNHQPSVFDRKEEVVRCTAGSSSTHISLLFHLSNNTNQPKPLEILIKINGARKPPICDAVVLWRKLELGVNWSKASKGSSRGFPKAVKRLFDHHLHHDVLRCNITGELIIGASQRLFSKLEFLVVAQCTEGSESYALHNPLRSETEPVSG